MAAFPERSDLYHRDVATGGEDTVDDKIMEQGVVVFRGYVIQRVNTDDPEVRLTPEDLGGKPNEGQEPKIKEVVACLIHITDELNRDGKLDNLINSIDSDSSKNVFFTVAKQIFSDDVTWGKVVALFHFAYKLVYKALTEKHCDIIHNIISWLLEFIRENISLWIRQHGGWEGMLQNVLNWHSVTVFAAGILSGALLYWKMSN
uniref:Zgc:153993 n=1 Tax=Paramormyrops kingsleyae TaxID=1676925 RepID=A0A3B3RRQ9_9TELE|nr:apoptosis regulator BAX-like isoform X1 [Paramormyrops kingsleyae]